MRGTQAPTAEPMTEARERLNLVSFLEEVRGTAEPKKQMLLNVMSAVLTHEQGGLQMYQQYSQQSNNRELKETWREFGEETRVHVQVAERVISALGGDPGYKSSVAKELQKAATTMLSIQAQGEESDAIRLGYLTQTETICKHHWKSVNTLARRIKDPAMAKILMDASRIVERDEDGHLTWNAAMYDRQMEKGATGM